MGFLISSVYPRMMVKIIVIFKVNNNTWLVYCVMKDSLLPLGILYLVVKQLVTTESLF